MTKTKLVICNQETLLQEEVKRRKQLRLLQVREISKQNAAKIREAFKKEKDKHMKNLENNIKDDFDQRKAEKIEELQDMVYHHMRHFGEGHQMAANYDDQSELRITNAIENENKAVQRGSQALKLQRTEKMIQENKENAHIIARQFALEQEKIRAAEVAKLPPKVDELKKIVEKNVKLVSYHDANAFMTTRYHMPETIVDKADENDEIKNAKENAIEEEARNKLVENEIKRTNQERLEKARVRGKTALEKEILHENYDNFLDELSILQKVDRERRQKELLNIPKEIFLPPWQREHLKQEKQLDLEREFEKIYANADLKQDIPQPIDVISDNISSNFDSELDITVIDKENEDIENDLTSKEKINDNQIIAQVEQINRQQNIQQEIGTATMPVTKVQQQQQQQQQVKNVNQENALNKILQKIRRQREETTHRSVTNDADLQQDTTVSTTPRAQQQPEQISPNFKPQTPGCVDLSETTVTTLESGPISDLLGNENLNNANRNGENKLSASVYTHNVSSLDNFLRSNRTVDDLQSVAGAPQYSIDLSHASRDPMVAGPKELFNKNDVKLALEEKQKQILRQQNELEKQLKNLEEREKEIKYNEMKVNQQQQQQQKPQVMSGKCSNMASSGIGSGTSGVGGDLTDRSSHNTMPTTSRSSTISEQKLREYQQSLLEKHEAKKQQQFLPQIETSNITNSIEIRKKEILQRFGITDLTNFNKVNEKNVAISVQLSEDKYTVSTDSGIGSMRTQQIQQFSARSATMRTQQQQPQYTQDTQDNTSIESNDMNYNQFDLQQQQQQQPQQTMNSNSSNPNSFSRLFGLEFFDSHNSEVRDPSIENLIGWPQSTPDSLKSTPLQQQQQQKSKLENKQIAAAKHQFDMAHASSLTSFESSTMYSSTNDTCNDEESSRKENTNTNQNLDDTGNEVADFYDEDDDNDDNIIISLLNSRKLLAGGDENDRSVEQKRKFIQEQLELIQLQKQQLMQSQQMLNNNNQLVNKQLLLVKTKCAPPVKSYRTVDCNPHELSTIKEENNTPMSERTIRRVERSNANSIDVTSSIENMKSMSEHQSPSLKEQFIDSQLTSNGGRDDTQEMTSITNNHYETLSPIDETSLSNKEPPAEKSATNNQRNSKRVAFNLSLFDPGSSMENSIFNLSPTNPNTNNNNSNSNNVFESLSYSSTHYESLLTKSGVVNNESIETVSSDKSSNTNNNNSKIKASRKKWFEILSDEKRPNHDESSLSQGPINDDNSLLDNSVSSSLSLSTTSSTKRKVKKMNAKNESLNDNLANLHISSAKTNLLENQMNSVVNVKLVPPKPAFVIESVDKSIETNKKSNNEMLQKTLKPFSPPRQQTSNSPPKSTQMTKNRQSNNDSQSMMYTTLSASFSPAHEPSISLQQQQPQMTKNKQASNNNDSRHMYTTLSASFSSTTSNRSANNNEKDLRLHDNQEKKAASPRNNQKQNEFQDVFNAKNNPEIDAYCKSSLLEEPEISFVSISTNSNVNSPMKEAISTPATRHQFSLQRQIFATAAANTNYNSNLLSVNHKELLNHFSEISPIECATQKTQQQQQQQQTSTSLTQISTPSLSSKTTSSSIGDNNNSSGGFKKPKTPPPRLNDETLVSLTPETTATTKQNRTKSQYADYTTLPLEQSTLTNTTIGFTTMRNESSKHLEASNLISNDSLVQQRISPSILSTGLMDKSKSSTPSIIQQQQQSDNSILDLSNIDQLINTNRNLLQTPASYLDDELTFDNHDISESNSYNNNNNNYNNNNRKSDSLISFERHEKSALDIKSTGSSPIINLEDESVTPKLQQKSPSKSKTLLKTAIGYQQQLNSTPKIFDSPSFTENLQRNSFKQAANSTDMNRKSTSSNNKSQNLTNSSQWNTLNEDSIKSKVNNELLTYKKFLRIRHGGIQFSIDDKGKFIYLNKLNLLEAVKSHEDTLKIKTHLAETIIRDNKSNKYTKISENSVKLSCWPFKRSVLDKKTISKREMHERTIRLCGFSIKNEKINNESQKKEKLELIKLNKQKLKEYAKLIVIKNRLKYGSNKHENKHYLKKKLTRKIVTKHF